MFRFVDVFPEGPAPVPDQVRDEPSREQCQATQRRIRQFYGVSVGQKRKACRPTFDSIWRGQILKERQYDFMTRVSHQRGKQVEQP